MKRSFIVLFIFVSVVANATTYYVATTGKDSNPGTISSPFATWGKLNSVLVAGDIGYIRGGTYRTTGSGSDNTHVRWEELKGTVTNSIRISAYPGEYPILNLDNVVSTVSGYCFIIYFNQCTYVNIKGLRVTGYKQPSTGLPIVGLVIENSSNCTFESIEIDHNGGVGISIGSGSDNILFKNCDVHHCIDSYGNPNGNNAAYEDANGFNITGGSTATNITFDGCRSWKNADDGFDFFLSDGAVTIKNCWSFWNGYDDSFNKLGDGQGFKLGPFETDKSTSYLRTITNCIAAKNGATGFDQNTVTYTGIYHFYNNCAYDNRLNGFGFNYLNGIANVFRNNVSFGNDNSEGFFGSGTVQSNNTWNGGVTVSAADFVSLDVTQLANPRQSDGSLPVIDFLHLNPGSDLIDAGVDVGFPYNGKAPDLGAIEFQSGLPAPSPVYVSAVVESSTPAVIVMSYDLTLANIIPSASSFSVKVNSAARTVNSVAISGTKVLLTLANPLVNGDVVTVSYTKPTTNPLQTASGGQAETLSAQTVVNYVSPAIPVYVSSVIQNVTPNTLEITYNLNLALIIPASAAFNIRVNSGARTVNTVTVSGTKVLLTLANPVVNGDIITVSYTRPATYPIQTSSGGMAATISEQTVINNVLPGVQPLYLNSAVENATPNILEMTYNLSLAPIVPAASAFTVSVNSSARPVNTVTISGTKVLLTIGSPVIYGDIITVAYTKPTTNPLQTLSAGQAATIGAQSVTNKIINPIRLEYINSAVGNNSPTLLEINYNLTLANVLPAVSSFTVSINSVNMSVNSVAISGASVVLKLAAAVAYADVITVAYNKPSTNPLQSTSGLQVATMSAQTVTNKVDPDPVGPVYISSAIENSTPNILEITYNEALDLTTPAPDVSAFAVIVNSVKREVTSVSISGNKVMLTLSSPVIYGNVVTVYYTKPASNQLKKATGGTAASFSSPQPVTNKLAINSIKKKNILIYPNPAQDFINISKLEVSSETKILRIYDFSGKLCSEAQINPNTSDIHVEINLRSGAYLVQVSTNYLILFTQKLIVMKY